MKLKQMKLIVVMFFCILFSACETGNRQTPTSQSSKLVGSRNVNNSLPELQRKIYLKIDEMYTGKTYVNKNKQEVFYRLLVVPEEENIMLLAENIQVGEEGGGYKLLKTIRLTNDVSAHPKSNLYKIDSLKFIDGVTVQGYFNGVKNSINLER